MVPVGHVQLPSGKVGILDDETAGAACRSAGKGYFRFDGRFCIENHATNSLSALAGRIGVFYEFSCCHAV